MRITERILCYMLLDSVSVYLLLRYSIFCDIVGMTLSPHDIWWYQTGYKKGIHKCRPKERQNQIHCIEGKFQFPNPKIFIAVEMLLKKSYSQKAWVWGFRKSLRVEFYSDNTTETSLILKSNKITPKCENAKWVEIETDINLRSVMQQ